MRRTFFGRDCFAPPVGTFAPLGQKTNALAVGSQATAALRAFVALLRMALPYASELLATRRQRKKKPPLPRGLLFALVTRRRIELLLPP